MLDRKRAAETSNGTLPRSWLKDTGTKIGGKSRVTLNLLNPHRTFFLLPTNPIKFSIWLDLWSSSDI